VSGLVETVIKVLHEYIDVALKRDPREVAREVFEGIKYFGEAARKYIETHWDTIMHYIADPSNTLELIKERDPIVYKKLIQNIDWLNKFFMELYTLIYYWVKGEE